MNSGGDAQGDTVSGFEMIVGSAFSDIIIGDYNIKTLSGGAGNDTLVSDNFVNDDVLIGGTGADTLFGGLGASTTSYSTATAAVTVNLTTAVGTGDALGDVFTSIENISGSAFADNLTGDDNDNEIWGGAAADIINGLAGNDTLYGDAGADSLDGGDGIDTASYKTAAAAVTANLLTAVGTGDALGDTYSSIERLVGSSFNDNLTGNVGANHIWGGVGNDTLNGGDGDDWLFGEAGSDTLNGGNGTDGVSYSASSAGVTVNLLTPASNTGDAAGDTFTSIEKVTGTSFADNITGNASANNLFGHEGDDTLNGGDGDDWLRGGEGADALNGGNGIDGASYRDANAGVTANLGTAIGTGEAAGDTYFGIELLGGSEYSDDLTGNANANNIFGYDGDDVINGGDGNDLIQGWDGNDTLIGGNGNDTLSGNDGNDTLIGGVGSDTFMFHDFPWGHDQINDFEDDFDKISFSYLVPNFSALDITDNGTASVTVTFGNESIVVSGAAAITLTASDFLFT